MNTHTIEVLRETTLARAAAVRRLDTRTMIPPRFSDGLSPIVPGSSRKWLLGLDSNQQPSG
jgi:hypothetical protein